MVEPIPLLRDALNAQRAYDFPVDFAMYFVKLHNDDWRMAQDHWERIVELVLDTDAVSPDATGDRAIRQAVRAAIVLLRGLGRCPLDTTSERPAVL